MKAYPNLKPDAVVEAYSVQTFVKRVNKTFAALLLLGACILFFLIYLPLNHALQQSLVNNFNQIFSVNYQAFENNVQRGLLGARSLSSRLMIKLAIQEYNEGQRSLEDLIDYCQSKYEDSAMSLESLVLTERLVDNRVIARYAPLFKDNIDVGFVSDLLPSGTETEQRIYIRGDHAYSVIISPVMEGGNVLGYDRLVFDLTEHLRSLSASAAKTHLLTAKDYWELTRGTQPVSVVGERCIISTSDVLIIAAQVQNDIYFISKQEKSTLFAPVNQLSGRILVASVGTLFGFILAVYLYVVRYANRELRELATSHMALEKVASEVNTDLLTKAGSRRYGTEWLMHAFADFKQGGASPLVMMFDVDCFKHINDSLGHAVGDRVLREVVSAVCNTIRTEDKLFRWGGDEFAGLFYGVSEENTLHFAEKILDAVLSLQIDVGDERVSPTISMGISCFKQGDTEFSDALQRADQALYLSKAEGRNRVRVNV